MNGYVDPVYFCANAYCSAEVAARGSFCREHGRAEISYLDARRTIERDHKMLALVNSFPCLRLKNCPLALWDGRRFQAWAKEKLLSSGERHAARFVLFVWNPRTRWSIGKFKLEDALGIWDDGNRRAFVEWVRRPWWP